MKILLLSFTALALSLTLSGLSAADDEFSREVRPFLDNYCVPCHGPRKQKSRIRVDHLTASMKDRKEAELWARMLEAIEFGEMPSDKAEKFPTRKEARVVQGWIARTLERQGLAVKEKRDKERQAWRSIVDKALLHSIMPETDGERALVPLVQVL